MTWREMVPAGALSLRGENRVVMFTTWWNVALLVLSVAALPFDRRRILGLDPWVKPIKFEISVIVFWLRWRCCFRWLAGWVNRRRPGDLSGGR